MKKYLLPFLLVLGLISVLGISACKDEPEPPLPDPATIQVDFVVKWGNNNLALEQYYPAPDGRNYAIQVFKCFISNLSLVRPDDSTTLVKDVALISFKKGNVSKVPHPSTPFKGKITAIPATIPSSIH